MGFWSRRFGLATRAQADFDRTMARATSESLHQMAMELRELRVKVDALEGQTRRIRERTDSGAGIG